MAVIWTQELPAPHACSNTCSAEPDKDKAWTTNNHTGACGLPASRIAGFAPQQNPWTPMRPPLLQAWSTPSHCCIFSATMQTLFDQPAS